MNDPIAALLAVQVILIALNAVFASAELAVLSVNEAKVERAMEKGDKRAKRLYKLTREPAKFLSTIQIAITLSGFLGSAFAADGFSDPMADWLAAAGAPLPRNTLDTLSVIFITLVLSYFTLIFGELVPKRIAMKRAESLALKISGIVSAISVLFRPVVWLLSVSTNAVLRLIGIDPEEAEGGVSEEEIRMMVETGGETGAIDKEEQDLIENVFEFDDRSAGEILTHRTDLTVLWMEDPDEAWEETVCRSCFSRYPVCDGSPDRVVGILNAKIYLRMKDRSRAAVLSCAVEPAHLVPMTVKADVLFREMKRAGDTLAVVLDEYGGMAGIVTINDLVEELVGALRETPDGQAACQPEIRQTGENTWQVSGNAGLEDIEKALDIDLGAEHINTLTGLVFSRLDKIPGDGESDISVQIGELCVQIRQIRGHQIVLAEISRCEHASKSGPPD